MNIENQVLSIDQVRELQELGFDIVKHASMEYAPIYDNEFKTVNHYLRVRGTGGSTLIIHPHKEEDVYISTLTIGDIIEILPLYIKDNGNNTYWREITYNGILYYRPKPVDWVFNTFYEKPNKPLIEALFEALKWCITNKYLL